MWGECGECREVCWSVGEVREDVGRGVGKDVEKCVWVWRELEEMKREVYVRGDEVKEEVKGGVERVVGECMG